MRSSDLVVSLNDERFCDTTAYARPWAKDFRIGATLPIRWGVTMGLTFKNNDEGALTTTYEDLQVWPAVVWSDTGRLQSLELRQSVQLSGVDLRQQRRHVSGAQ